MVVFLRDKLLVAALVAATAAASVGVPMGVLARDSCVRAAHHCNTGMPMATCCAASDAASQAPATIEARTNLVRDWSAITAVLPVDASALRAAHPAPFEIRHAPPRKWHPDFPTLYASLLI